jgi:cell division protein FtsB
MTERGPQATPTLSFLRRNAPTILILLLLTLLVHDVFGAHGFLAMRRTRKEIDRLRQEIRQVNEENRALAEQVKALKSDPRIIERIAREEMGLARPGELIFKLPAPAPKQETPPK